MNILKWVLVSFAIVTTVFMGNVYAADSTIKEFEPRTSISTDKNWTIKFNFSINKDTINNDNISITDLNGNKIKAYICAGESNNSIIVTPKTEGYTPGQAYYLNLTTGVKSVGGKNLVQPVRMKFNIVDRYADSSNYENLPKITDVKMQYEPITPNQKQSFTINSSVGSQAQYRVYISKYEYKKDLYGAYEEVTNGYTYGNNGNIACNKFFDAGENGEKYKVLIYVKRPNVKGAQSDDNTDFDNYYIDYFRCVKDINDKDVTKVSYDKTLIEVLNSQKKPGVSVTDEGPSTWVGASTNQIKYYLNPDNFMDQNGKYIFLKLTYIDNSITEQDLNNILKGRGILENTGKAFIKAGKDNNINPVYLVSHALLETGNGTSKLATGIEVDGDEGKKKVYNMFGIKAYDSNPDKFGSEYAYSEKWFTPEEAIIGGAKFIAEKYINNPQEKRDTLYKMKWNPFSPGAYQYATDIGWAYKQVKNIKSLLDQCANPTLVFEVPIYKK